MEWLDWHIESRLEGQNGPVLRLLRDGEVVDQVALTPGEMASVKRKFDSRLKLTNLKKDFARYCSGEGKPQADEGPREIVGDDEPA